MLKHNPVLSFSLLVAALACSRLPLEIGEGIDGVFPPGNGSSPDEYCVAELELCLESGRDGAYCERERDRCEMAQYPSTGGAAGASGCSYVAAAGSAAYQCPGAGGTTAGGAAGTTGGSSGDCAASGGRAGAGGGGATGGYCGGSAGASAGGTSTGGAGAGGTGVGGAGAGGAGTAGTSGGGTSAGGAGTAGTSGGGTSAGGAGTAGTSGGGTSAGGTGAGGGAPSDCISPYDACLDSGEEPALCHELFSACEASAS